MQCAGGNVNDRWSAGRAMLLTVAHTVVMLITESSLNTLKEAAGDE